MIRWPFVMRSTMDAKVDGLSFALDAQKTFNAHLVNELAKEQKRSEYLNDVMLQMRVSGATVAKMNPDVTKVPQPRPSDIDQALDENKYTASNPRLRAHQARWAEKEIEKGDGSEAHRRAVLDRLRNWSAITADEDDGE